MKEKISHKGLDHEEMLLFEIGGLNKSGVDFPESQGYEQRIGSSYEDEEIELEGSLSPPKFLRKISIDKKMREREYILTMDKF